MNHVFRKMSGWLSVLACLGFFALPAESHAASDDNLGPGDSIRITVFEHPDLTTETRLSARGLIRFPLLGDVDLGGLTPGAAGERIATLLESGNFIKAPQVGVAVIQVRSRQVSVLGQVARPGRYALDETRTTLTDLLALAGGIAATGDEVVTVIRQRDGGAEKLEVDIARMYQTGEMSANVEIGNGDTVYVRRAPVFYIYGEVQRAGTYRLENGMTVMQALSLGGGITQRGTERGIKVSRRATNGTFARRDIELAEPVAPDDILYVRESLF